MGHCTKVVSSLRPRAFIAAAAGALLAAGGMSLAAAAPASAATFAVVNCSTGANLQDAINSASAGETLYVTGTCIGNFDISENLTIVGPATLDANGSGTVLFVVAGTVTVEDLTIEGGSSELGGGIRNGGTLTLNSSQVTDNSADPGPLIGPVGGGGIVNGGALTLDASRVTNNSTLGLGGGIWNVDGTLTLNNSQVQGNTALRGGGIYNSDTTLLLGSSVQANTALDGGGIYNDDTLILKGSLVTANSASQLGGGIYNDKNATTPTVEASKVAGNTPDDNYP